MSWHARYLSALQARDAAEHSMQPVLSNYTQLADRLAQLVTQPSPQPPDPAPSSSPQPDRRNSTPDRQRLAVQANIDLAEAQRARAVLEARAKELTQELQTLKASQKADQRQIQELGQESTALGKKVKDRDEELREKAKLLDDVHNETVALTIQLNVSEETNSKLRGENKELVDRWMARMGREADAMNNASNFN